MSITATVQSQPITASVNSTGVFVSVGSSTVSASASGGIGPQGAAGTDGGSLDQLSNVQIDEVRITRGVARTITAAPTAAYPNE